MKGILALLALVLLANVASAAPLSAEYAFGIPGSECSGHGVVGGEAVVCFAVPLGSTTLSLRILDATPTAGVSGAGWIAARVEFPGSLAYPEDICDETRLPVPVGAHEVRVAVQSGVRSGFCPFDLSAATNGWAEATFWS